MDTEKLYLEIINNLSDGVYFVDTERRITFWNKAAEDITGYNKEEMIGELCQNNLLSHINKDGLPLCLYECPLYATIIDGCQRKNTVYLRHKDGRRVPVLINIIPIPGEKNASGAIEIFTPVSQEAYDDDLIENLSNLAMHDQLTGLPNRKNIEGYLEYRLHEIKRFKKKLCVIFLDIDSFCNFNNLYGHRMSDDLLKNISKSISNSIRKSDFIGRWGGEEFVGVFEISNDNDAAIMAEKIRILISNTEIYYKGEFLSVTGSLGVTLIRNDDTIESVIQRADSLLYQCKQRNRNCVTSDIQPESENTITPVKEEL